MLKRSKSEIKSKPKEAGENGSERGRGGGGEGGGKGTESSKGKGIFRLSLRKKNRASPLESCDDEFTLNPLSLTYDRGGNHSPKPSSLSFTNHGSCGESKSDGIFTIPEELTRTLDPKFAALGCSQESAGSSVASCGVTDRQVDKKGEESESIATSVSPFGGKSEFVATGISREGERGRGEEEEEEEEEEEALGRGEKETQTEKTVCTLLDNQ